MSDRVPQGVEMASIIPSPETKTMRKGTRSCRECRRRKIKCTWTSDHSEICHECDQHKRQCISQGFVNNSSISKRSTNLKIRIGKLESIIERLSKDHAQKALQVISETDSSQAASSSIGSSFAGNNDDTGAEQFKQVRSPLFDLFQNDVLRRKDSLPVAPETSSAINFASPDMSDREKILSTIGDDPDILDVLDVAGIWWLAWEGQYPGNKDLRTVRRSLRETVKLQIADENPVVVTAGLLSIALSLQYIRVGVDDQNLQISTSTMQLVERITVAVDQVVLSKPAYIESAEGVEVLIMKAKQHAESSQLRKAWLRIRQAIKAGQKIGLASPQPGMSPTELSRRQKVMGVMFEIDRFMSLLLGLPYAVDENFTDTLAARALAVSPDLVTRMRALRRIAAIASGHINDRNASSDPNSLTATTTIQQTLNAAASSLPVSWWDITAHTISISDPTITNEHLAAQLWFYQTQYFLQLPFMLRAASDSAFEDNRVLCLNSCRNILRIFNLLHQNALLCTYARKSEDFQGLLGAIILLVGLLQYASQGVEPTGSSFDIDLDIVDMTKETFRTASQRQGGAVAKQGLHVIETLSGFLEDDGSNSRNDPDVPRTANLFVPYFGTISVQSGPSYRPARRNRYQHTPSTSEIGGDIRIGEPIPALDVNPLTETDIDESAQQYSTGEIPLTEFDWDRMMLGTELEQDWNLFLDLPMDPSQLR